MIHKITLQNHKKFLLFICLMISIVVHAQIGIGTTTPNASSILDVVSTTKGMLAPRMTTAQRTAIVTPANGLIVYDTDLRSFYYYVLPTTSWSPIGAAASGRTNFKRIKAGDNLASVLSAELSIGGNKYVLNTSTLYEINGAVNFDKPIDLNNAYIQGLDSGEDKIIGTGNIFEGSTGGTIKGLTLVASGKVFNLATGTLTENIILRDCIVANSTSVGKISGYGFVFISIVQFVGNADGIIYTNIGRLLLSNLGWFGNNTGTFERLEGTFGLVQKQGGFSEVEAGRTGFDVSSNPTITGDAVLESVVFSGANTTGYILPYPLANRYPGYNFSNAWYVDSPGIPREGDAAATANLYKNNNRTFVSTQTSGPGTLNKDFKVITGNTTGVNLFRFTATDSGRLTYTGKKSRAFQVTASVSYEANDGGANTDFVFYFVKVSSDNTLTLLPETETYTDTKTNSVISTIPVSGTVILAQGDSIELHLQRISGSANTRIDLVSYNLSLK